jgi:outer membrane lipoprotein carrier protein
MKLQHPAFKKMPMAAFGAWSVVFLWSLVFGTWNFHASGAESAPILTAWLNAQTNIHSWSADFTQTKTLKSLSQPLTATGHAWFAAPNRARWELGHPPQTIVLLGPEEMLLVYPKLKRAERYPLTSDAPGQWRDMMKLLEAGFSRNQAEFEAQYNVLGQHTTDDICEVTIQPKSAAARKMTPQIKISFSTKDFSLRSMELQFADGSTLRNDFKNTQLNERLDDSLFTPKVESDYKISEPFKQK